MPDQEIEQYHFRKEEPHKRQFEIYDLKDYPQRHGHHTLKPHTHSFYQILWFKNNAGKHFIDFESYEILENRLFFIAKNQVHYFEERTDYEGYLIHFNESFIVSQETDINFFLTYHIFNNSKEPFFQIPQVLKDQFIHYFQQIELEVGSSEEFGNDAILSYLLKALLLLVEREKRKELPTQVIPSKQNSIYLRFRDLLENNFHKHWTVSDYASELAISNKTLNKITKAEMRKTASLVIADRLILEAKRRLTHTHALVYQIGLDLGFNDPYYFVRYFKKHVKCSPTEFRNSAS